MPGKRVSCVDRMRFTPDTITIECAKAVQPGIDRDGGSLLANSRILRRDEIETAHTLFGDTIDWSVVRITVDSIWSWRSARTIGNTIHLWHSHFEPDGATLTYLAGWPTLIHELTHIWQYQQSGWGYLISSLWAQFKCWRDRSKAYDWESAIQRGVPWEGWNAEQQAQAVEDYYRSGCSAAPESFSRLTQVLAQVFDLQDKKEKQRLA